MNETPMSNDRGAKTARVVKWALIVAITIVMNLFFNYAISLVYKEPAFETFCPNSLVSKAYNNKDMCVQAGGQWNETTVPVDINGMTKPIPTKSEQVTGYCNVTYTCQQKYDDARTLYNRNVFIVLVVLGVLSLVAGAYLTHLSSVVSLGFSFGGVLSLIIGSMRYWSDMQDVLRVVMLGVALAVLVWLGIKKIKE